MRQWFKAIIATCPLLLSAAEAFSQSDTTLLRAAYEKAPRDVKALTAYTAALENAGDTKKSEALVRRFMERCPVTQIEDRDTYLLISRYVFEDPYSNVFEYGLFFMPRMKWDADQGKKDAYSRQKMTDMRWGVSHGAEVDKRFEVMALLSRNLKKAVDKLCDPVPQENGIFTLPEYDEARAKHLNGLLNRGNVLPDRDAMRTKLRIADAVSGGRASKAVQYLCTASELGIQGINGAYLIGMMNVLADRELTAADRETAIDTLNRLCRLSETNGDGQNYYSVLGKLYTLSGQNGPAEECRKKSDAIEAERQEIYRQMMNPQP